MDANLRKLASKHHCTYTRYAGDLTFSTLSERFPVELAQWETKGSASGDEVALGTELQGIINSNGFETNEAKTRIQIRGTHQEVTGLTVNAFPNVPRAVLCGRSGR